MENSSIITVENKELPIDRFEKFLAETAKNLITDGRNNSDYYRKNDGEKLEPIVYDKMCSLASEFDFSPQNIHRTPKQHFPDIISEKFFGVEVKSTKSNSWKSTGSSIVESLRDDDVKRIYLMFGKLSDKEIDFRCKPYEKCLYDISVTHSPRYQIDMDLTTSDQTIFEKIGLDYDQFRQAEDQINIVKGYYRKRYKANKKEMPWWIEESPSSTTFMPESLQLSSSIRLYNCLTKEETDYLKMCSYILFPEILGTDKDKYQNLALWLCSRHSIISPNIRDSFTAGGQVDVIINEKDVYHNVPKVVCNFLKRVEMICKVFNIKGDVYEEIPYYASYYENDCDIFEKWKQSILTHLAKTTKAIGLPIENIFEAHYVEEFSKGIKIKL